MPPTPANKIGYVALFGYRGAQARRMDITKNEGITGVTGGWVGRGGADGRGGRAGGRW